MNLVKFFLEKFKRCPETHGKINHVNNPTKNKMSKQLDRILNIKNLGAVRLELTETEVEGFTVPCNCHYATPPIWKICWRKELNPQPSDYKSGALPIELHQQKTETTILQTKAFLAQVMILFFLEKLNYFLISLLLVCRHELV